MKKLILVSMILLAGCSMKHDVNEIIFEQSRVIRLNRDLNYTVQAEPVRIDTRMDGGYSYSVNYYAITLANHTENVHCFYPRFNTVSYLWYPYHSFPVRIAGNAAVRIGVLKQRPLNLGFKYTDDSPPELMGIEVAPCKRLKQFQQLKVLP